MKLIKVTNYWILPHQLIPQYFGNTPNRISDLKEIYNSLAHLGTIWPILFLFCASLIFCLLYCIFYRFGKHPKCCSIMLNVQPDADRQA